MRYLSEIARSIPKLAPRRCSHDKIPWRGNYLAEGADGKAYENWNDEGKVVKVGFIDTMLHSMNSLDKLEDNFDYVYVNKPKAYVEVYDYGCVDCRTCNVSYYVLMQKLEPLDGNETYEIPNIVRQVQQLVNSYKKTKDCPYPRQRLHYKNQAHQDFAEAIWDSGIIHNDAHHGNIMKDSDGNYKLIDLDRLSFLNFKK